MPYSHEKAVRIILADDHELVRSGIRRILESVGGVQVVAEAREGAEVLRLLGAVKADIVLTDLTMPGMDGLSTIQHIRQLHPSVRIVVLSMHVDGDLVRRAIAAGACGYLSKDAPDFELNQAVRGVMRKGSYFSPSVAQRLLQPSEPTAAEKLTERQLEVLTLLAQGKAPKQIGFELGLSSRTVDVHRARIMQRLQLHDLASLVRYAVREGLVEL